MGCAQEDRPDVLWIMLNPSTADAKILDPTIRRCIGFAKTWGYGGIVVANLFAYRATDPRELVRAEDPVGPWNDYRLKRLLSYGPEIVGRAMAAWGGGTKWLDDVGHARMTMFATNNVCDHTRHSDPCEIHVAASGGIIGADSTAQTALRWVDWPAWVRWYPGQCWGGC